MSTAKGISLTKTLFQVFSLLSLFLYASALQAEAPNDPLVEIQSHWVRPTLPGQKVGAAYMTLRGTQNLTLTHVKANITDAIEIHEMKIEEGIMKMRQLKSLALPKNKAVELAPGGMHLMLFNLKQPLQAGNKVTFELCFADSQGKITIVPLQTEVMSTPEAEEKYTH